MVVAGAEEVILEGLDGTEEMVRFIAVSIMCVAALAIVVLAY